MSAGNHQPEREPTAAAPRADGAAFGNRAAGSSRGVPLAALFIMVSAIAVVLAMVQSGRQGVTFEPTVDARGRLAPSDPRPVDLGWVVLSTVCFAMVGMVTGAATGVRAGRTRGERFHHLIVGGTMGTLLGGAAGFLVFCPPRLSVVLSGSGLLVAMGLIGRRVAR